MLPATSERLSSESESESDDEMIATFAQRLVEKRLSAPAIFLLELHKPLVPLFHAGGVAMEPLLSVVMGKYRAEPLVRFFESRENIEMLITKVEALEHARES